MIPTILANQRHDQSGMYSTKDWQRLRDSMSPHPSDQMVTSLTILKGVSCCQLMSLWRFRDTNRDTVRVKISFIKVSVSDELRTLHGLVLEILFVAASWQQLLKTVVQCTSNNCHQFLNGFRIHQLISTCMLFKFLKLILQLRSHETI